MRVLGKPEISNAIKLVDLETLMSNFGPPSPRDDPQDGKRRSSDAMESQEAAANKEPKQPKQNKRKQQVT